MTGAVGFDMRGPRPTTPAGRTPPEIAPPGTAPPEIAPLEPDATVDLEREWALSGIGEVLAGLDDELVGLATVKERVRQIAADLLVGRVRARFGLATNRPNLHMCFTGSPGTGKTTVAVRMAGLLHRLGHLRRDHLVTVTRDDLVGQYVGHTAPRTKEVLKRAMGGVLFIDEAYHLHRPGNERDYGQETIEILLQVMENQRDDLVVILAGYADRMETFFASNPGMSSRIGHHIDFPDYTGDELAAIGALMLRREGYELAPEAEPVFRAYLDRRSAQPWFANARSVRNALERARLRHANRLVAAGGEVGRAELATLRAEDFLASRVFTNPGARPASSRTAANGGAAERSGAAERPR